MGDSKFRSMAVQNPRLAPYVASSQAAWLWSTDGSRILWCNAAAAAALGIADPRLLEKPRSPADPHGRQVAQLARRLAFNGAPRLERLRGFGARLGQLMTCACSRFEMQDGEGAILLVAMEPSARGAPPAMRMVATANPIEADDRILKEPVLDQPLAETPSPETQMEDVSQGPRTDLPAEMSLTAQPEDSAHDASSEVNAVTGFTSPRGEIGERSEPGEAVQSSDGYLPHPSAREREHVASNATPLRFVWQIDTAGRFSLTSDEFLRLAGERTALVQGRTWAEVAKALALDPQGRIAQAIARRETFSGIASHWPLEGPDKRGWIELSGMPIFDGARNFTGYRGFGLYRPAASPAGQPGARETDDGPIEQPAPEPSRNSAPAAAAPAAQDSPSQGEAKIVEPPQNVVPFPLANDTRGPSLSAVENHAFDEIARRLTQRLEDDAKLQETRAQAEPDAADKREAFHEPPVSAATADRPAWLATAAPPPRGDSARDRMLLDLVPSGILIYRLDRLLYANRAFLDRVGIESLHALQEAGGLDALYVEPGPGSASSASGEGLPLKIAPSAAGRLPLDARLFSIVWDGETAHALILQAAPAAAAPAAAPPEPAPPVPAAAPAQPDNALEAILETATDGIVLFDRSGDIVSCNRSAEALFGLSARELGALNFADLFAAESQRVVLDYFESLDRPGAASPLDHGREVLGRERSGGFIPLSMTMGRNSSDIGERSDAVLGTATGERSDAALGAATEQYFAVFRDLSQLKKNEQDLLNAHRRAERATAAKADALASISHEIRGPLNTVIGFANVMLEERFGAIGNERYAEYLKDIRASAERVIAILDDIVNISSIETGSLDLKLVRQDLNEMVAQCVSVLQPQANRERVIIRTSLSHALPPVMADTQALRQITMNIVTSSIRFSKAGGQVIVSTAPGDGGGAILRVRDTGRGLSEAELASTMGSPRAGDADRGAVDISLARALAEANGAQFQIKTTENSGTLIEVAFTNERARARS